ncbi:MAG: DUF3710 domain-containing protein [Actinomycetaceae bacterium]|nr:DUF3710 domain-containing protein [Actinomycetaceae bacterium]
MGLFGRKKRHEDEPVTSGETEGSGGTGVQDADSSQSEGSARAVPGGPYDISERDASKGYIDLGPLKVPAIAGLQLQPQLGADKKSIVRLNIVVGNSVLQVLVAAGPKSGGGWKKILEGTRESFEKQGAEVDYNENGPWGEEILAKVPVKTSDGRAAIAPTRIVGMDGKRWVLRVDIIGAAVVEQKAFQAVASVISNLVVERDNEPRPPLSVIPMTIPDSIVQKPGEQDGTLKPVEN